MNQPSPLGQLIDIYTLIVFVRVIVSWFQLPPDNPIVHYSRMLTEPVLAPIRQLLPPAAGLDFSPIILLVLLHMIGRAV